MTDHTKQLLLKTLETLHDSVIEIHSLVDGLADSQDARLVQLRRNIVATQTTIEALQKLLL